MVNHIQCYRRQAVPMEQCKIRPSVTVLPVAIITKLSMIDYVGDPYSYANYG